MKISTTIIMMLLAVSMVSCASNKNKNDISEDSETMTLQRPISVGAAEVTLEVVEAMENQVSAKVVAVLGYGASTPSLSPDEILTLTFDDSIADAIKAMGSGDVFSAVISKSRAGMNMQAQPDSWNISEIITDRGE